MLIVKNGNVSKQPGGSIENKSGGASLVFEHEKGLRAGTEIEAMVIV